MSRKRQKNQLELAFAAETRSEAPTNDERVELFIAEQEPESGGTSERLMEEQPLAPKLSVTHPFRVAPEVFQLCFDFLPYYFVLWSQLA
jgi:hypothetical protein